MLLPGSARSLFLEACLSENITCDASVSATWCEKQILRGYKKGGALTSYFGCKKGGGVCVLPRTAPKEEMDADGKATAEDAKAAGAVQLRLGCWGRGDCGGCDNPRRV